MNKGFYLTLSFVLVILLVDGAEAQVQPQNVETAEQAESEVRSLYSQRDFLGSMQLGKELQTTFPESDRLQAWTLMSQAHASGAGLDQDSLRQAAVQEADQMIDQNPESPWGWFALAGTARFLDDRTDDALEAHDRAMEIAPNHTDILWVRTALLNTLDRYEDTITFAENHVDKAENPAPVLAAKATAVFRSTRDAGEVDWERTERLYEEAIASDPNYASAHYFYARALSTQGRAQDALPHYQRSAELSPTSVVAQQRYWSNIQDQPDLSREEQHAKIEESIERLLEYRDDDPDVLQQTSRQYAQMGYEERQQELEERILELAPYSEPAEWVLVNRYREFRSEHGDEFDENEALRAEYRSMLESFIDRPQHARDRLLGDAYRSLFHLIRDEENPDPEELIEVVNGMVKYEGINPHITHGLGAIHLAKHTDKYERAREIAREGMELAGERIDEQHERGFYDTEQDYEDGWNWFVGQLRSAFGWVYFHEGRLDEAEEHLNRSYEMHRENDDNLYRLGQLYETQGNLEQAELFYREGYLVETMGTNPNEAALEELYEKQHGSLDNFDEYMAELGELSREERKETALASRIEDPEPIPAFELDTMERGEKTLDDYEGQILAINIWGKWCAPCVREMPEVQKLYENYRDDPEVAILTINNDQDLQDLREWLEEHDYTFPVLIDDGYLTQHSVHSFPTTWFVNPDGEIEFEKRGYTEELAEEFGWKIEAIRDGGTD